MIEQTSDLTPKKLVAAIIIGVAVIVAILFQIFWNPDKESVAANIEVKKLDFLQNLVEPQMGTLYSLDPVKSDQGADGFHGYQILKEVKLSPEDVAAVALEFKEAVESYTDTLGTKTCFDPRLGLRVVKNGKNSDFLISYECMALKGYGDGKDYSYGAAGSSNKLEDVLNAGSIPSSETVPVPEVEE